MEYLKASGRLKEWNSMTPLPLGLDPIAGRSPRAYGVIGYGVVPVKRRPPQAPDPSMKWMGSLRSEQSELSRLGSRITGCDLNSSGSESRLQAEALKNKRKGKSICCGRLL